MSKIRLTGGEPLLRHDLPGWCACSSGSRRLDDLALTTNGILLARHAGELRRGRAQPGDGEPRYSATRADAGVRPECHARGRAGGYRRRARGGLRRLKLNVVVIRGYNDDELADLIEFGRAPAPRSASSSTWTWVARPTGRWTRSCASGEILERAGAALRADRAADRRADSAPAERFRAGRWDRVRRHRLDHGALLPHLRSQPAYRRRHLAALPVRGAAASICGRRYGCGASDEEIADRIAEPGAHAPTGAPRSGPERRTAVRSTSWSLSAPIRTGRCTPGAGDGASRRPIQPQIPPNTGNIARLCVATDTPLHLIEPLGFSIDDARRAPRRPGLLGPWISGFIPTGLRFVMRSIASRCLYFSAKARRAICDAPYRPNSCLVFGSETEGMPLRILEKHPEQCFTIPMTGSVRSLNLANAVSIVLYEALRQTGQGIPAQSGARNRRSSSGEVL